ncbi:MAG TPA: cystathionine beta-lyase, partial [Clostridiaceae bacterium]|nr:cystathionine beta-lyase [Clostridiaceae bacterium]
KAGIGLTSGTDFGEEGEGFMRLNFGCPRSILEEGLNRIDKAVKSLQSR